MLSFKNMVELYVLEGLRKLYSVHLHEIRKGIEYLREIGRSRHPIADYDIRTDGKYVQFYENEKLVNATEWGQYEMEDVVRTYLRRVQRHPSGVAELLYPYTNAEQMRRNEEPPKIVELNPDVCFGLPVLAGSRLTTGFLASRYRGGDSISTIAKSYGRSVEEVKEAIEWETGRKAA
jgi:uncharacterized protein (DUF433 family)